MVDDDVSRVLLLLLLLLLLLGLRLGEFAANPPRGYMSSQSDY